ncbi:alpha/beta fold hydrolase [Planctomicrobium sp. SH668]|uniref:alpha/beta fold hydrolase n=1 Tax=Planctomicrobium sp. SH668 TaxID=3448126 RepID=UPI003F5C380E
MSLFISLPDIELHVFDDGEGDPIVFIHGFPLDHSMWDDQINEFAKTNHVIAPDLRGFGQSEDSSGPTTMETFADDIADLLTQLDIQKPVTLCGLSMGGYVAWQFWKRHGSRLRRLILCDTKAAADSPEAKKTRIEAAQRVLKEGQGFLAETMPEKLFSPKTHETQPDLIAAAQQSIMSNSPMGIAAAQSGMAGRIDATDWLPEISIPVLLIVGEDDVITPVSEMQSMAERLPDARLVIIPNAGHMAPQEQPEAVNTAIREFLKSTT